MPLLVEKLSGSGGEMKVRSVDPVSEFIKRAYSDLLIFLVD